jgi:predicted transcriptional regulator
VTVDCEKETHPTGSPPDETILHLLEEHKALPTDRIAAEIEESIATIRDRLKMMAEVGLIERRETANGDVWLIW